MKRELLMRATVGAGAAQASLEERTISGAGAITVEGAVGGLAPLSLIIEGGVLLDKAGTIDSPCSPIFVGEHGVFRSSTEFKDCKKGEMCDFYFDGGGVGQNGYLLIRFTLGAPCEGKVSVIYDNASGEITFPKGSVAGDMQTLLLPLGTDGVSGDLVWVSCSTDMRLRLTACASHETTYGTRVTFAALNSDGSLYALRENDITSPLRAIPNGTADYIDILRHKIVHRVSDTTLYPQMLLGVVPSSMDGPAPAFMIEELSGCNAEGACLYTHGEFLGDSSAWESGAVPGLYGDGKRFYVAIPRETLQKSLGSPPKTADDLLLAARIWMSYTEPTMWYAYNAQNEWEQPYGNGEDFIIPSTPLTMRIFGDVESRLITLRAYYRKEV